MCVCGEGVGRYQPSAPTDGADQQHAPGFQSGSNSTKRLAPTRFRPTPPARDDRRNTNKSQSEELNRSTCDARHTKSSKKWSPLPEPPPPPPTSSTSASGWGTGPPPSTSTQWSCTLWWSAQGRCRYHGLSLVAAGLAVQPQEAVLANVAQGLNQVQNLRGVTDDHHALTDGTHLVKNSQQEGRRGFR